MNTFRKFPNRLGEAPLILTMWCEVDFTNYSVGPHDAGTALDEQTMHGLNILWMSSNV